MAQHSTLTLHKDVVGGTAAPSLWQLRAMDGPTYVGGQANSAAVTNQRIRPGTYRLTEEGGPEAYEQGEWGCQYPGPDGTPQQLPVNQNAQVSISLGQQVTCTVVNTAPDDSSQLTLVKALDDAEGPLHGLDDFTLTAASEEQTLSGVTGDLEVTHAEVEPGVAYALSEDGPAGYESQGWSCQAESGQQFSLEDGDGASPAVTLDDGADVTCTVTNAFTGGWLTLAKEVEGSSQPPQNWTLTATGTGATEGTTLEGTTGGAAVTQIPVPAGEYALEEAGPGGYLSDGFQCNGGTPGDTVTVGEGEEITCTITNTRDPDITQLTLAKQVDNTGGGPLPATAWGLRAEGLGEGQRNIAGLTGQRQITYAIVEPGTYELIEEERGAAGTAEQFDGYTNGDWVCTAGGQELDVVDGQVTLVEGTQTHCEVTNTWSGSTLTYTKELRGEGVAHAPGDWYLRAVPDPLGEGEAVAGAGDGEITAQAVAPGEYELEEEGPDGYRQASLQCADHDGNAVPVVEGTVSIPASSDITCTVTNEPIEPTLTLQKVVHNDGGGTAEAEDFILMARGPGDVALAAPMGDPSVTGVPVVAGDYVFQEDGPEGYAEEWTCDAGWDPETGVASIGPGENVTCTATNTFVPEETPSPTDITTTPPPTEPGTTEPGTTEPGTTEPGTTEPGTTEPGTTEPGTTEPGTTEPGTTEPGTTEPGTTEPTTEPPTEPGTTDPATTEPATTPPGTESTPTGPGETEEPPTEGPGTTEPGATPPETTEPGTTPPSVTDPGEPEPSPTTPGEPTPTTPPTGGEADPGPTEPGPTEPGATEPAPTGPGATEPGSPDPDGTDPATDPPTDPTTPGGTGTETPTEPDQTGEVPVPPETPGTETAPPGTAATDPEETVPPGTGDPDQGDGEAPTTEPGPEGVDPTGTEPPPSPGGVEEDPPTDAGGGLAVTGGNLWPALLMALAALVGGGAMLLTLRHREQNTRR
ncbi:prealbumin-like fold domain-containing protein [Nesterenkonia flava]|uniref:SpaA-like prealbumin fold domain-containing protein n=1 Tax=Nesterenkonia flava TaxID=469799 RepID=A0ABU1FRB9_9MICC|nr:hypothetical protein [Nesterenkonia flava]MDR5710733.1 hypothetical protein [Nesterenkonia flava]